jgi:hypothetical protein
VHFLVHVVFSIQFEKIADNSEITTETIKSYAKEGLNFLNKHKREYENNASETEAR